MTSLGTTVMTPQGNRSLLNSVFKFKELSKLCKFVKEKGKIQKSLFTLGEILAVIHNTVIREGLYDERNPPLIICSDEMENAINMKALHTGEMRSVVLRHLQMISNEEFIGRYCQEFDSPNRPTAPARPLDFMSSNVYRLMSVPTGRYTCKPDFLAVLNTILNPDEDKVVFTFTEIISAFGKYILTHKEKFIDDRNSGVAIIKGDLLESVFKVSAFHKCQATYFVRNQLIPYSDKKEGKDNETLLVDVSSVPRPPLVNDGEKTVTESETELTESEYEPDSEEEHERPQLAGGRAVKVGIVSSDSDSDTEQRLVIKEVPPADLASDNPYWGGVSDEEDVSQTYQMRSTKMDTCTECGTKGDFPLRLCPPCWRTRKDWIGAHARKRKRRPSNTGEEMSKKMKPQLKNQGSDFPKRLAEKNTSGLPSLDEGLCLFCCLRPRDAGFVHGRVGHQVCCYPCAKKTWIRGSKCPVCKRTTEKIIRIVSS